MRWCVQRGALQLRPAYTIPTPDKHSCERKLALQIVSIVAAPDFPGWLQADPTRLAEFFSADACLPTALRTACVTWLISMPVLAANLVLVAAVESR